MSGIIDGRKWLETRRVALEAELNSELGESERRAIETELARVRDELAASRRRFRRWVFWGGTTPR